MFTNNSDIYHAVVRAKKYDEDDDVDSSMNPQRLDVLAFNDSLN